MDGFMKRLVFFISALALMAQGAWGATATIVRVDGKLVTIDLGASRGIVAGMTADVLTEAGRVVHPVTGEDYGLRRVKIGEIQIEKVEAETSVGRLTVTYGPVKAGDIADGLVAIPSQQEQMRMDIDEARAEIRALARGLTEEIKSNQKAIEDLRQALQRVGSSERRLQSAMNAVQNMRERMVLVESRVSKLEEQQKVAAIAQESETDVLGKLNVNDMGVLERGQGEEIFLRIGDRTYRLNFEANRMEESVAPVTPVAPAGYVEQPPAVGRQIDESIAGLFDEPEAEAETETPWFMSWWFLAGVLGFVGFLGAVAVLLAKMKRRAGGGSMAQTEFEEVNEEAMVDELPDDLPELELAESEEEK